MRHFPGMAHRRMASGRVTTAVLPAGLLLASFAILSLPSLSPSGFARGREAQQQKPSPDASPERFDMQVRSDMFAGMAGDREALERAMKLCEQALAQNQKNAAALVWHGSGLVFQAGQMFRAGNFTDGKQVIVRGFGEMDDAVALAPESLTTLIPRGASLLGYAAHSGDPARAKPRLLQGLADYEKVLAIQKPTWNTLPVHSRGELLSGLVAGWMRAGDAAKARNYAQHIVDEMPGTRYAARAKEFLAASPAPTLLDWQCMGCHASAGN